MAQSGPGQPSDELLMQQFGRSAGRAVAALEQLVARYRGPALGVARQMLFDHSLAEDAVQESFIRVIRGRDSYDTGRRFSVWFYTILRNICVDLLRRRRRELRALRSAGEEQSRAAAGGAGPGEGRGDARAEPSAGPADYEDPADVERLLAGLAGPVRRAVVLRVIEGLAFRDVGAALGITEEAAKKRVQRGLRVLRASMESSAVA